MSQKPVDLDTGSRLLCLLICAMDKNEKLITFWCTCEVVTARIQEGPPPARGVGPGTQWVMRMDLEQRKLL
ncbi:hypothetical protein [Desulfovibrio sp. ZJ369]|uniref:hypothetical protein n=1 Tax=Desulfovibrio sp. ZJ369 TaxID=2709793 RepID=UPI001F15549D|nr:hypothetical protein [Desulfovibrio sp. ZJ369]